ncbi:MAG: hypothetical protein QW350_02870 [Candidatus Aenigmatarchaeota archaeon]|nr:hypothetical protein [Candidatus Aenigmarchaeota archaeon]
MNYLKRLMENAADIKPELDLLTEEYMERYYFYKARDEILRYSNQGFYRAASTLLDASRAEFGIEETKEIAKDALEALRRIYFQWMGSGLHAEACELRNYLEMICRSFDIEMNLGDS